MINHGSPVFNEEVKKAVTVITVNSDRKLLQKQQVLEQVKGAYLALPMHHSHRKLSDLFSRIKYLSVCVFHLVYHLQHMYLQKLRSQ